MTDPLFTLAGRTLELRPDRRLSVAVSAPERIAAGTVLFIHGAGGRKAQWRALWPEVAGRAKLIAWDAPGHGDSPPPTRPAALAGEAWVEDARALLRLCGAGRIVLVGHSYGCRIALGLLARLSEAGAPDRVAGTLLLAPPALDGNFAVGPLATEPLWKLALKRGELERGFRLLAWSPAADPALVAEEEGFARRNRLSTMQHLFRGALATPPLDAVQTPVTILAGADDRLTPHAGAEALAAALPNATAELVADCGHQIMLEQPGRALQVLLRLIG